jgi:3',5'-cyclic AMP phosphodiesterase CpdA
MARLIHMSELHFAAHYSRLVEAVEQRINEEKPDLVVISGDFTQRARTDQFQEACQFLERLRDAGHDVLGVPGNHDVPLYDVLRRFLSPLTRYKRTSTTSCARYTSCPGRSCSGSTPRAR